MLPAEEIARRRREFEANKEIAKAQREKELGNG
jgi:hypothetical protein